MRGNMIRSSIIVLAGFCAACSTTTLYEPNLGDLYSELAQAEDPYRNPLIVIPGISGSRLRTGGGEVVWGAFGSGTLNPKSPEGAQAIALPMREDATLAELTDDVYPDGALDTVRINFLGIHLQLKAYYYILSTLGVAGYRDDQLASTGAVQYGPGHYTCFQYDYDWRRDIVESAKRLHAFILDKRVYVVAETEKRFGIVDLDVKFDIVVHSMGSLVARYYLRYGSADLPDDGSLPPLTWEGAKYVENVILIGPPNAGSVNALLNLVDGVKLAPLVPRYSPAVVGTMPALYQLLPRGRHGSLVTGDSREKIQDVYDSAIWEQYGWGLADPDEDKVLEMLMPDIADPRTRRQIALDHQRKSLERARQLAVALDIPATPPGNVRLHLIAGDAVETPATVGVDPATGELQITVAAPGDGTVLRSSALMDERVGDKRTGRLQSPIGWDSVQFLFTGHRGMTKDPAFTDNVLYSLLEEPRKPAAPNE